MIHAREVSVAKKPQSGRSAYGQPNEVSFISCQGLAFLYAFSIYRSLF